MRHNVSDTSFLELQAFFDARVERVLLTFHRDPDLDAVGAALGLAAYLTGLGKHVTVWSDRFDVTGFEFLHSVTDIANALPSLKQIDTIIVLDCSGFERVANWRAVSSILDTVTLINWDHHGDNQGFGDMNLVSDISSMGEYVTQFLMAVKADVTYEMAHNLYAAMVYDTGCFAFSNVSAGTFQTAAWLMEKGVSPDQVSQAIYEQRTIDTFHGLQTVFDRLVVNSKLRYAYSYLSEADPPIAHEAVDMIRTLKDMDVLIMFRVVADGIKINFRSKTDFDVSKFAKQFGGGGHAKAAGTFMTGRVDEVIATVVSRLDRELE